MPFHRDPVQRSHLDKTIVLLKIGERYVPIVEGALKVIAKDQVAGNVAASNSSSTKEININRSENDGEDTEASADQTDAIKREVVSSSENPSSVVGIADNRQNQLGSAAHANDEDFVPHVTD